MQAGRSKFFLFTDGNFLLKYDNFATSVLSKEVVRETRCHDEENVFVFDLSANQAL